MKHITPPLLLSFLLFACGGDDDGAPAGDAGGGGKSDAVSDDPPAASEDWTRDVLHTDLELDLAALTGRATIELAESDGTGASFHIGDLSIAGITGPGGVSLDYTDDGGELHVGVPDTGGATSIAIDYSFKAHEAFDGWDPTKGLTFLWPYFCENLFPCHTEPTDGEGFSLAVTGVPDGKTAIYPQSIAADAPTYMPAIAVGDFTEIDLGTTTAGTHVSVWHLPGEEAAAAAGGAPLREVFDFYEQTYGAYLYGDEVGSVSAAWGAGAYGGMEHHPFWHVATDALGDPEVSAHEAAHGWFGNGVRIGCWEDFVLSEGTASYLAARALDEQGVDVWKDYGCRLKSVCSSETGNAIALPDTCNTIDIFTHPIWSLVPYMKGAFFLRAAAGVIGEAEVDTVLAAFYADHAGETARMMDLVHALGAADPAHEADIEALATHWLTELTCPVELDDLCEDE